MATPADVALLQEVLASGSALLATKYLAASALVSALYDHILTFDEEVAVMWQGWNISFTKVFYVYMRYGTEGSLIYVAYILSGLRSNLSDEICRNFAGSLCVFTLVYPALAHTYMTLRHYALWDHGRRAMIVLVVILLCTYLPVAVFAIITFVFYRHHVIYQPQLELCLIVEQPSHFVVLAWGCMCAFDLLTIILAVTNSLHRPHRQHSDVLNGLKRDGAIFFVCVFALRLANLMLYIMLPPLDQLLGVFSVWAMVTVTLTRLILRVEAMKKPLTAVNTWVPAVDSYELGRWSHGTT